MPNQFLYTEDNVHLITSTKTSDKLDPGAYKLHFDWNSGTLYYIPFTRLLIFQVLNSILS